MAIREEMIEGDNGSVWNFDAAEFYVIFQIKNKFVDDMLKWNLEGAYWTLRTLRMEIDAKLKRKEDNKMLADMEQERIESGRKRKETEKEDVDNLMHEIDLRRKEYNSNRNPSDEARGEYYLILEGFYMYLCFLMKKHGMYFREGDDSRLAIFRR